jgi:hypothetical protein
VTNANLARTGLAHGDIDDFHFFGTAMAVDAYSA